MENIEFKNRNALPVHRVALLKPFIDFMAEIGAPVERGLRSSGLPMSAIEDIDNYIPSSAYWKFLTLMARSEDILDLGFRVGHQYGPRGADPGMVELLNNAPTMYQGLINGNERINRTVTNCQCGILQPQNSNYAIFYHIPSCRADNSAIDQVSWFGIETLLSMVRVYTGKRWQPSEIGLMQKNMPVPYIREHFPDTRFQLSQPYSYIALENTLLSMPPYMSGTANLAISASDYKVLPTDFASSLESIMLSYIEEEELNIEFAARICGMSKRSLQRQLAALGTSYNQLLSKARFRHASRLLQTPRITVTETSVRLGYSDVAHFGRAFRRTAGISPSMYRQQFMH